ncbi:LAETG motif-containing sortase-dependent surface protein [Streptomyces sp. NPDC002659]|uniref:LAETG motif-containing sortase-dependent surface protein n=1 Tax=Streptomyces sp. NPDC002659 TaxID=3364656 RepID=UPI0036A9E486
MHLSPRFSARRAVSAAAVLLTVVTPVAVAGTAVAQHAGAVAAPAAGNSFPTEVVLNDSFELGQRTSFSAEISNKSGKDIVNQKGLLTVAYGKQVNAALERVAADPSKVIVEHLVDGVWERLPVTADGNNGVRATFTLKGISAVAVANERFQVTIDRSIPADVTMGEVGVGGTTDGTGMDSVGFGIARTASRDADVRIEGLTGKPNLTTGGKPVEFRATVTNNSGKDLSPADFFFIGAETGDLDPAHVTVERRAGSGAWIPVALGEQDQAVSGNLDKGALKNGKTRSYTLRLGLTHNFPKSVKRGDFALSSGKGNASFDFTVKHHGASPANPDVNRDLEVAVQGLKDTTALVRGGAAQEFGVTVSNKGNISQQANAVMEITDQDAKRRLLAGEIRLEQNVKAAANGWKNVKLVTSDEAGHLMARISPNELDLAPGDFARYTFRIAAAPEMKAKAFHVDMEVRASLSSDRVSIPFSVTGTPSSGAAMHGAAGAAGNGTDVRGGRMAETGSSDSTPALIGGAGLLVAVGAGGLLIARRRAL